MRRLSRATVLRVLDLVFALLCQLTLLIIRFAAVVFVASAQKNVPTWVSLFNYAVLQERGRIGQQHYMGF